MNDTDKTLDDALDGLHFAMVGTADPHPGGQWKSRPLALAGQSGGVVRFLVSVDADWVDGLEGEGSPATVTFSDPAKSTYVALQGEARTRDDRPLIAELWNIGAASYFQGKDDPKVRVLEVSVSYGEFWDGPHGRLGQVLGMATAALGGSHAGEQGDVVV